MPWLVLPMRYVTIVPHYAIDRLLTTDLGVNFLMNADKMLCKPRFFSFSCSDEWEMQMSYANAMIGLTNALCNHCALICYWQTPNYCPRCPFSMNANKTWCKSRFLFLMQMPFIKMRMQNIHMMHMFSFQGCNSWCKCLLTEMKMQNVLWCKCFLMGMSWCKCSWCKCSWCKCPLVGMSWCKCSCMYVMM